MELGFVWGMIYSAADDIFSSRSVSMASNHGTEPKTTIIFDMAWHIKGGLGARAPPPWSPLGGSPLA